MILKIGSVVKIKSIEELKKRYYFHDTDIYYSKMQEGVRFDVLGMTAYCGHSFTIKTIIISEGATELPFEYFHLKGQANSLSLWSWSWQEWMFENPLEEMLKLI